MGGANAVDQVRRLELRGSYVEGATRGALIERFAFPDRFRRDLTVGGATFSVLLIPGGAFLISAAGSREISQQDRRGLELAVMRNPLALLKTRRDPTFSAAAASDSEKCPGALDKLLVLSGGTSTDLCLDPATGAIHRMVYRTLAVEGASERRDAVRFSDFRPAGALVYPFVTETSSDDQESSAVRLDTVVVDGPIDDATFEAPKTSSAPRP